MTVTELAFKRNAKPGKRIRFSNYCLTCGDPIPPNKEFCSESCENEFYRDNELDTEEEETLAEQEELRREEGKLKSGLFEEVN